MKRVWAAVLVAAAALATGLYLGKVSPVVNAPLALHQFDEPKARARVLLTAERLLDNPGPVDLRLSASTDRETLQRLQRLIGLSAASHWASTKLPIQRWTYRVVAKTPLTSFSLKEGEQAPLMTVDVSGSGQVLSLELGLPKQRPAVSMTQDEARRDAEDLLRFLGVDVGSLALTAYNAGEVAGRQKYDFSWKAPVQGLPGVSSEFAVTLEGGYIKAFSRKPLFEAVPPASPGEDLLLPLLALASWFFLSLLLLFLLVQKLRRDEVDFTHVRRVFAAAGLLAFVSQLFQHSGGWAETLLGAFLVALLSALFFGLLWTVAESFLRQAYPEKLKLTDVVLNNLWWVRDTGRAILACAGAGLVLLTLPVAIYFLAAGGNGGTLVLMPWATRLQGLPTPGGLAAEALLGPLPWVVLLGTTFLGILYPFLRLRFRPAVAGALFCALFAAATAAALPVGPVPLALLAAAFVGAALFWAMEFGGFLCGFAILYVPMLVLAAAPLLTARSGGLFAQGVSVFGLGAAVLLMAAVLASRGRSLAEVQDYEPAYVTRVRERERFARELEIAKNLQERFLPKQTPSIRGFTLAARCTPAMEVGGDYFDYLPLPGGRWLIVLGDVSGKGVKAAFYMTLTKGILHAVSGLEGDHTTILCHLNRLFGKMSEDGAFLTLCAVVIDPESREAQIISAGHNPPVLIRRGEAELLDPKGLVLGLMPNEVFLKTLENCRVTLEPGDALLLYTDGVTEAMDRRQEEFGTDRLLACLAGTGTLSAEAVLARISESVRAFCAGAPQADDLTLLVVKVHEP